MSNFYNLTSTEISSALILLNLFFSLALQLVIVFIYKKTHRGLSYSPSFIFTLVMVGVLGTVVMMVVQNNLVGAFALLGAFSLIRFRTILKETRDIAFVFFALVMGVAIGTNHYSIALISAIFISLIVLLLNRYNVGSIKNNIGFILTFNAVNGLDMDNVRSALSKYSGSFDLLQTKSYGIDVNSYVFSLSLRDDFDSANLLQALKSNPSISNIEIITGEKSVEY